MKSIKALLLGAAAILAAACGSPSGQTTAVSTAEAPHLEKRGDATQLIVNGKPWLALACETGNSSTSSRTFMAPYWAQLKEAGLNTVIGTTSWEQVEPEQGVYDFHAVDEMIEDARANDLKLIVIWFASWKNGISSYHPKWVKSDTETYPLAKTKDGKDLPILSTLGEKTCEADAKAYAALMQHIKDIDSAQQTVIMIQMQNEMGLHGWTRDYCDLANAAFAGPVPQALIDYLQANKDSLLPETLDAWKTGGFKTSGTWEEVFGKNDRTDEIFMAWNYASYVNKVSAAGKAVYPIPVFVNAWIVQPEDKRPGNYPSGGPQAQNHDIYRAAAPNIDILSPDIYLSDFPTILRMYARNGNPVFIPESRAGQGGAANAAFAIGEMNAIGYSPFGLETSALNPQNETFCKLYHKLGDASDVILSAQAEGRIHAAWLKGSDPEIHKQQFELGDWIVVCELVSSGRRNGGAPQLTGGTYAPEAQGYAIAILEDNDILVLGSNVRVTFLPKDGNGTIGLAKVTEGEFVDGKWVEGRWLNGDQIQLRYDLLSAIEEGFSGQGLNFGSPDPGFIKVELYKY